MYVLLMLGVVDWLLPAVHIPLFAWCLLILLWVCRGAVRDAKKFSAPKLIKKVEIYTPELDWVVSPTTRGVYSTTDSAWQIVKTEYHDKDDLYVLFSGDGQTEVFLTAIELAAAMDQADIIINTLTPGRQEV